MNIKDKATEAIIKAYVERIAKQQFGYFLVRYDRAAYKADFIADEKQRIDSILNDENYIIPDEAGPEDNPPFFLWRSIPLLDRALFVEPGKLKQKGNNLERLPAKNRVADFHRRIYRTGEPIEYHLKPEHLKEGYSDIIVPLMPAVFLRYLEMLESLSIAQQKPGYTIAWRIVQNLVESQPESRKFAGRESFEFEHFPNVDRIYQRWQKEKENAANTEVWLKSLRAYFGKLSKEMKQKKDAALDNQTAYPDGPQWKAYYQTYLQNTLIYRYLVELFGLRKQAAEKLVSHHLERNKQRFNELWTKSKEPEKLISIELQRVEQALTDRDLHTMERPEMGKNYHVILGAKYSDFSEEGFQNAVAYYHYFSRIEPQVNYWDDLELSDADTGFIGNSSGCKAEMLAQYRDWLRSLNKEQTNPQEPEPEEEEPTQWQLAAFYHYLEESGYPTPIGSNKTLTAAYEEIGKRHGVSAGHFKQKWLATTAKQRPYPEYLNDLRKVLEMLEGFPKAEELCSDEIRTAESRQ